MTDLDERAAIGTSGWVYEHWQGEFYPKDVSQAEWFGYYAQHFNTVEINNTFYQLPAESQFKDWNDQAPAGFRYAVKANRYLTHMKKLKEPVEAVDKFVSRVKLLEDSLGPILWQLPPNWGADPERLRQFADLIPAAWDHAFEFRDPDWFSDEVKEVLEEKGLGFVVYAMPEMDCPTWVTSNMVYLRFHGSREKYVGRYGREKLEPWADRIRAWSHDGKKVYCYFNNDEKGNAVKDAMALRELVSS